MRVRQKTVKLLLLRGIAILLFNRYCICLTGPEVARIFLRLMGYSSGAGDDGVKIRLLYNLDALPRYCKNPRINHINESFCFFVTQYINIRLDYLHPQKLSSNSIV